MVSGPIASDNAAAGIRWEQDLATLFAGVGDWQGGAGAFHDSKLCRFIGRVSGGVERCLTGSERSDWFIVGGEPPPVRKIGSLAEH